METDSSMLEIQNKDAIQFMKKIRTYLIHADYNELYDPANNKVFGNLQIKAHITKL